MTPSALVETLRARGIELLTDGHRIGVRPAGILTTEEREALRQHKAEVLALLAPAKPDTDRLISAYRIALEEFWRLMAAGPAVTQPVARAAYNEVIRLVDEVGEPTATALRHRWEVEWHQQTGRCPRCGEVGERHE